MHQLSGNSLSPHYVASLNQGWYALSLSELRTGRGRVLGYCHVSCNHCMMQLELHLNHSWLDSSPDQNLNPKFEQVCMCSNDFKFACQTSLRCAILSLRKFQAQNTYWHNQLYSIVAIFMFDHKHYSTVCTYQDSIQVTAIGLHQLTCSFSNNNHCFIIN